jgi:GrpB-like predicted nucleotidyltransferase (UPF0157 family)
MRKVEVVPHDPNWRNAFDLEAKFVTDALGTNAIVVHHIGSTAIPDIYAKPVLDLLVEVADIIAVDDRSSAMESIGYQVMGEFGIPQRRYFRKDNQAGLRTHHIHAFPIGSPQIERHLAFRDYMRTHPEEAFQYSELKRELARKYPTDIESYMDGKDGFIKEIDKKAARWRSTK